MSANPTLISTVRDFATKIQPADATAAKDLVGTPAIAGTRLKNLIITSDDTAARVVQIVKLIGAVAYILGEIDVPIGAGTDGATAPVDGFASTNRIKGLQTDGVSSWIDVASGDKIQVQVKVAVTAAKTIYVTGEGGDFT